MQENKFLIPVAIVIAGGLIAWGLLTKTNTSENNGIDKPGQNTSEPITFAPINEKDHILGNPNADVVIIEYSDLECPFCKNFHNTTVKLMDEFGESGKLAVVFRHFPIDQLHSKARQEAVATECAASLGGNAKFWEYMEGIFAITPSNNGLDLNELPKIAKKIGLDEVKFNECLKNPEMSARVEEYYQDGLKAGVLGTPSDPGGTPYSLLAVKSTGKIEQIKGAQPYDVVKLMIQNALTK